MKDLKIDLLPPDPPTYRVDPWLVILPLWGVVTALMMGAML